MIADRTDSTHFVNQPEPQLSPPHFDETASANAQPVQPIRRARVAAWSQYASSLYGAAAKRSRTLALVVIAGLATGTLSGMAWHHSQVTSESSALNESVSESPGAASQDEQPAAAVIGGSDLQSTGSMIAGPTTRIHRSRTRGRSSQAPRAYRVAVIR
ncbi:MAG: hypothetical protein M3R69_19065 [Acidobacteriota bacterium]|nr:hypothetical protein [Acidobacteriota bacterium]